MEWKIFRIHEATSSNEIRDTAMAKWLSQAKSLFEENIQIENSGSIEKLPKLISYHFRIYSVIEKCGTKWYEKHFFYMPDMAETYVARVKLQPD
jgi:hypothetical protein